MNWSGVLVQDGFWFSYVLEVLSRIGASVSFLAWFPFFRTGDETDDHIDARCILAGRRQALQCMSFFGGCIIGLHSGMGVFTVV